MSWMSFVAAVFFAAVAVADALASEFRAAAVPAAVALLLFDLSWRRATR